MAKRYLVLTYGVVAYLAFLGVFFYAIGFIGGFLTPTSLDGPREESLEVAVAINCALLLLFALQHSGMARPAFKRWLTQIIPLAAERSTYVLLTCVALVAIFAFWQPIGGTVWTVDGPARYVLWSLYGIGWLIVLVTTCLINHFDLFGLRQVWLYAQGRPYVGLQFVTPVPYRWIRHPLYVGWFTVFWATPNMSVAHLLFAVITTCYILVAIRWEERDLIAAHPEYAEYRARVPMLFPRFS